MDFLTKDFQINQRNQNSALLNLIGLLNIQSFLMVMTDRQQMNISSLKRERKYNLFSKLWEDC